MMMMRWVSLLRSGIALLFLLSFHYRIRIHIIKSVVLPSKHVCHGERGADRGWRHIRPHQPEGWHGTIPGRPGAIHEPRNGRPAGPKHTTVGGQMGGR